MVINLINEFLDVLKSMGNVIKKCDEVYKMVEVNKVFVKYCF